MIKKMRQCFAIASILVSGISLTVPDLAISKFLVALGIALNAVSLYLLKEESDSGAGQTVQDEASRETA